MDDNCSNITLATPRFVFVGWKSLLTAAVIYIILPLISIMVYYLALLFQEEARRRLAITINKGSCYVVFQTIDLIVYRYYGHLNRFVNSHIAIVFVSMSVLKV